MITCGFFQETHTFTTHDCFLPSPLLLLSQIIYMSIYVAGFRSLQKNEDENDVLALLIFSRTVHR